MTRRSAVPACLALLAVFAARAGADGPGDRRDPYAGFICPAGGARGASFTATSGGQNLGGVSEAIVSGDGVRVTIVAHMRPLNAQQRQELLRRLQEIRESRRAAANPGRDRRAKTKDDAKKSDPKKDAAEEPRIDLPDYPMLRNLAEQSDDALRRVADRFLNPPGSKRQTNPQLAESVDVEIEIAPGAAPGPRELRFRTPAGLTNPLRFDVGTLPEAREDDDDERPAPVVGVPVVFNGQVLPGEEDRVRVRAKRGQRIAVAAKARELIPFLADAVPGWFQAVLSVEDPQGREIAWADDTRTEPDPRLEFRAATDGEYTVAVRDALWRGREDFVYRLEITEAATAETPSSSGPDAARAPRVPRATDAIAVTPEAEPNDSPADAQGLVLPRIVAGNVARPGDTDHYVFAGRAGDDIVVEVEARRDGAPTDSVVRLLGPAGDVVAWNDDFEDGEAGTATHHADSYLRAKLPSDGAYVVRVADAQRHGGPDFTYRLRVSRPMPDFELVVTPASVSVPQGRSVPLHVHAVRRDGFDGPIDVAIAGADGFDASGARIPAGRSGVRMTITALRAATESPAALRVTGRATIANAVVDRPAIPAEDRMQAFFYRHLAPAQDLLVAVTGARRAGAAAERTSRDVVRIASGGTARVLYRIPGLPQTTALVIGLDEPPAGFSVAGWEVGAGTVTVLVACDAALAKPGFADNLLLTASVDPTAEAAAKGARRQFAGWLPALPVEVVAPVPEK